jgi:hypothetical protein
MLLAMTTAPVCAQTAQDIKYATSLLRTAFQQFADCRPLSLCKTYFDSFGVAISLADGSVLPLSHVQRKNLSAHACILRAQDALSAHDRALAVQWVMASQLSSPNERAWVADHPDAILEGLRNCCHR